MLVVLILTLQDNYVHFNSSFIVLTVWSSMHI